MKKEWYEYSLGELLHYEQPAKFIVESTDYNDKYHIPVLTAGKSFVLGYTNETAGIYRNLPAIIFDDFTTSSHYVNFPFKVKSSAIKILTANVELVLPKFVFYRMQIIKFDHSTHRRYWIQDYSKIKIRIPSILEQENVVSNIEELLSQLDSGVETLNQVKQQLAVYRQAVLKEAFDTALSDCSMFPIEHLLSKGRKGMSTGPFGTIIKKSDHKGSGVPMLGIENIGRGKFLSGNKIFVSDAKARELEAFKLEGGDIIISRSGTVGELCAVPKKMEGSLLSTNLMRVTLDNSVVRTDYFIYLFQSCGVVLDQVKELCKGSTRDFLNQRILKKIVFPIPSVQKQAEIVSTIEEKMSVCDNLERTVNTALQQSEAMRQSILKKAFEEEL